MQLNKRWFAAGVAVASLAAGAGIAYAAWSATGTGPGAGSAIVAKATTVNPVTPGPNAGSLYPGGPAGWVYLTITNQNPYDVNITHLNWGTPTSTSTASCPTSNISLDANAPTTINITVPANTTSGALQIFGVLDLSHSAPDGCQGVEFLAPVTVSGAQT
jgi:hypothetical protein